jgi:two-component system, chemotaxis family, chemotaxis protein CheY
MSNRVIIADDAAFIREVLGDLIRQGGHTVVAEARDGVEAIELVREHQPDLVIMDIIMPRKSGIQAAQEVMQEFPQMKIIACSTEGSEAMILKAMEAGCVDYILKPFKTKEVLALLNRVLGLAVEGAGNE